MWLNKVMVTCCGERTPRIGFMGAVCHQTHWVGVLVKEMYVGGKSKEDWERGIKMNRNRDRLR